MAAKQATINNNKESVKEDDILIEPGAEDSEAYRKQQIKKQKKEKKEKEKQEKKDKKRKKGGGKIVPILVLLLVIGAIVAVLGFNVFDIREKYLRSALQNIPIVNNLLPVQESAAEDDPYAGKERDELIAEISSLTAEVERYQQDIQSLNEVITADDEELTRLRVFEEQQTQYRADKAEFDRLVAAGDPNAYAQYYESISPENEDILYQQAAAVQQNSKDIKKYVADFTEMSAAAAARILEQLMTTDMELVTMILGNLKSDTSGSILEAMDPVNAASAKKMLVPTPMPVITNYPPPATEAPGVTPTPEPTPTTAP